MKISVMASTKPGYQMPLEEALDFSGRSAGICYWKGDMETLFDQPEERVKKRVETNLKSGHHSVFAHATYNISLEGIPKILAMILNNEKAYNTSEKSARYTRMESTGKEKELYEKWIELFSSGIIAKNYPDIPIKRVAKFAQENARYLISIFTPATSMEYTVSFQQLNFIFYWFREYIENEPENVFSKKLKPVMQEFCDSLSDLEVKELNPKMKGRKLSLFATRERKEEFGENYSTNYYASFAELGELQRHRTISYEMRFTTNSLFYVPIIIRGTKYEGEWLEDISSLKSNFPQGMLVRVNERGTLENFVLKCTERLCGAVLLETMQQTRETMEKYVKVTKNDKVISEYLSNYSNGPRCTFPGWKCNTPCIFGPNGAFSRKI